MTPLRLTLRGFIGIRDGMGRDELTLDLESVKGALVAITGPNGTGKTTILDNLHPYRIMPSRATSYSVNAFSYWNQVYGGEASKTLEWSHAGVRYRSALIFRSTGKTKGAEAYLQVQKDGAWHPYNDGTLLSDGKNGTYDACIESILGTPELYFTAAFSAQGRKLLSGYTNAEIKSLLSSLLGLGHIEDLAVEANDKRLQAERNLTAIRDAGGEYEGLQGKVLVNDRSLSGVYSNRDDFIARRDAQRQVITDKTTAVADARSRESTRAESGERANRLHHQLQTLEAQETGELAEARIARDKAAAAVATSTTRHLESQNRLQKQLAGLEAESLSHGRLIARKGEVIAAGHELKAHELTLADLDSKLEACEAEGEKLKDAPTQERDALATVTRLQGEANGLADTLSSLKRRALLVGTVPCAGMELQSTCDLLKDARAAKDQVPAVGLEFDAKHAELEKARETLDAAKAKTATHADCQQQWRDLNNARNALLKSMDVVRAVATMLASIEQAEASCQRTSESIIEIRRAIAEAERSHQQEHPELQHAADAAAARPMAIQERYKAQREPILKELDAILSSDPTDDLAKAEAALTEAQRVLEDYDKALDATRAEIARLEAEKAQLGTLAEKALTHEAKVAEAADDLAHWTTLCKALGPNGVIALVIDDAGPTLAGFTNDLLRASYGTRFSVRIDTQHLNSDGTYREDFDIKVFDANTGEAKSLVDMSGGERIWNNDALCAATGVLMNQQSGRNYECRMSDEADGALDAEKKCQYMAMKREVLKLTGMSREFFISHSTSTWELADAVIDLGQYVVRNEQKEAA